LRFPLAPGFRRFAAAIRRHTPSCKGARLSRSTFAREASHLRNATSAVGREAAIVIPKSYINEVGNATFLAENKAFLFMRYIRLHLEMIARAKREQEEAIVS
jgi:hypothetical protein